MRSAPAFRMPRLTMIDAYLLRLMAMPMLAALAVTLSALLLERVLRLFELLTGKGAPLGLVVSMAVNLVAHQSCGAVNMYQVRVLHLDGNGNQDCVLDAL
mgnify:CR=1 FL=1